MAQEETKEKIIVKELVKAFKGNAKIHCWDIRKLIIEKRDGCLLYLDVIHRDELDYDVLVQDVKAVEKAYESLKALGYSVKKMTNDIVLPDVNPFKLYEELMKECHKQYKKTWGEEASSNEYSIYFERA